jgi:hypothetical protein
MANGNDIQMVHLLETIVGRLDIMNENLISIVKLQQQGMSVIKGTTTVHCDGGVTFEISECMEDREGYIHHVHWCKGECNL